MTSGSSRLLATMAARSARLSLLRAHSLAGIALAPGRPGKDELLLGWAGFDGGQPVYFVGNDWVVA